MPPVSADEPEIHRQQLLRSRADGFDCVHVVEATNEGIEIGPYLTKLCASLAASMIGEGRALSIKVQATSGSAPAKR